jgi:Domain of unknown function (DUF4424)
MSGFGNRGGNRSGNGGLKVCSFRQHAAPHVLTKIGVGLLTCTLSWTLACSAPQAFEPTAEIAAGGLTYAGLQFLLTEKEETVLAADRVTVSYVVRNTAAEPKSALIAFALPDIDMLVLDGSPVDNPAFDPQNPTNFVGFVGLVDGKSAETFVESRAMAIGLIDVSAKLTALNLPLYPLHPKIHALLAELPEPVRADLAALSLIRLEEGQWQPLWRLKTTLFWQQSFAAKASTTLAIDYRPIVGSADWTPDTAANLQQRFCVPQGVADDLARRGNGGASPVPVKWVSYLATTGASSRGSIGTNKVSLSVSNKNQAAYTCHDRLKTAVPAGNRHITTSNTQADDDILVLFVD